MLTKIKPSIYNKKRGVSLSQPFSNQIRKNQSKMLKKCVKLFFRWAYKLLGKRNILGKVDTEYLTVYSHEKIPVISILLQYRIKCKQFSNMLTFYFFMQTVKWIRME